MHIKPYRNQLFSSKCEQRKIFKAKGMGMVMRSKIVKASTNRHSLRGIKTVSCQKALSFTIYSRGSFKLPLLRSYRF